MHVALLQFREYTIEQNIPNLLRKFMQFARNQKELCVIHLEYMAVNNNCHDAELWIIWKKESLIPLML